MYKPKEFKVGESCPLCNGQLVDINKGGLHGNFIRFACSFNQCLFNMIGALISNNRRKLHED